MLVVADRVDDKKAVYTALELAKKTQKSLLIFSEDMRPEPLSVMVYNHQKENVRCCAVNVPWMNNLQTEILRDVAVATGATLMDPEAELNL